MADFKLNEEQVNLMKKFNADANDLKGKYYHMKDAFEATIKRIKNKMNACDNENVKEIQNEIETIQRQITYVIEKLGKVETITSYYAGYKSGTRLLIGIQEIISEAMVNLGKLEGYSSGEISTFSDIHTLNRNYEALKKSLLGE